MKPNQPVQTPNLSRIIQAGINPAGNTNSASPVVPAMGTTVSGQSAIPMIQPGQPVATPNLNKVMADEQAMTEINADEKPMSTMDKIAAGFDSPLAKASLALMSTGQLNDGLSAAANAYSSGLKDVTEKNKSESLKTTMKVAYDSGDLNKISAAKADWLENGGDPNVINTMESSFKDRVSGISATTGNIVDPITGKVTYRQPIPTSVLEEESGVQVGANVKQAKLMSPIEVDAAIAKAKGLSDIEMAQWKIKNPVEYAQDLEKQSRSLAQQGENAIAATDRQMMNADIINQRTLAGQYKDEFKAIEPQFTQLEQSFAIDPATGMNQYDLAKSQAEMLTSYPNILNTAADQVAKVFGSEANDALKQYRSTMTSLAMAMHNGGVMTDADFKNYMDAQGDPTVGIAGLKQIIDNNAFKAGTTYDRYLGMKDRKDQAQAALGSQPRTTDSGASVGGGNSAYKW